MTFVSRLTWIVTTMAVVAVVAVAAMCLAASERVSIEIDRARVANLLTTLRTATESNLGIGLSLDQVSSLQERIEREKANDPMVLAIDVFNSAGRTIYSTDRSLVGETVLPDWISRLGGSGIWQSAERGATIFGISFENDLGVAGGISVTVSDHARLARTRDLGLTLFGLALLVAAATAGAAALGAVLYCSVVLRPFDQVARLLADPGAAPESPDALAELAIEARQRWKAAEERVEAGLGQLGALDDAA